MTQTQEEANRNLRQMMLDRAEGGELPDADWNDDVKLGIAIGMAACMSGSNGSVPGVLSQVEQVLALAQAEYEQNQDAEGDEDDGYR